MPTGFGHRPARLVGGPEAADLACDAVPPPVAARGRVAALAPEPTIRAVPVIAIESAKARLGENHRFLCRALSVLMSPLSLFSPRPLTPRAASKTGPELPHSFQRPTTSALIPPKTQKTTTPSVEARRIAPKSIWPFS